MIPPDNDVLAFIKDFLWAPLLGLVAWAWHRNEKEHDMLREVQTKLRDNASAGYSTLNDRLVEHVDTAVMDMRDESRRKSDQLTGHIAKLFENAEHDRAAFNKTLADHRDDSFKRHIELMNAIHGKADK